MNLFGYHSPGFPRDTFWMGTPALLWGETLWWEESLSARGRGQGPGQEAQAGSHVSGFRAASGG